MNQPDELFDHTPTTNKPASQVATARRIIDQKIPSELANPMVGVVLGTGMGSITSQISNSTSVSYCDIPFFKSSTVKGHTGELVFGTIDSIPIVAMNGRYHFYEGYSSSEICFPIEVLCSYQISSLIIGNASGGINPKYKSGEVMVMDDHLDLFLQSNHQTDFREPSFHELKGSEQQAQFKQRLYSQALIRCCETIALENNLTLHRGIYAALTGPNYETRSEYRFLKKIGADVVGMSTVPEAIAAAKHGVNVCGLSTITNVAKPDVRQKTSHEEVIAAVATAESTLSKIVCGLVRNHRHSSLIS